MTTQSLLGGNGLGGVEAFTYLGSIVNNHFGTGTDAKASIDKTRAAFLVFLQLKHIWSASAIATQTNIFK